MKYSIAIPEKTHENLRNHLIREDDQEDLCFALFSLSTGQDRITGIINEILLPEDGDRTVHGNVSFNSEYFDKITQRAISEKKGIVFIHSHPSPGWQNMSYDDYMAEEMLAPRVKAISNLPLIGLTIGNNGDWSARFWIKEKPKLYQPHWCESVRVIGKSFSITFNDKLCRIPKITEEFSRTVSAWGVNKQNILSRLKVGIVGIGSVGSQIAEALLRTGIHEIKLIDFDIVERKNLDRLHGLATQHVGFLKTDAYSEILNNFKLIPSQKIESFPCSISEEQGLKAALDCDILFCCVDRPWARFILNCIAYSALIPVIDGGIDTGYSKPKDNLDQARWRTYVASPERRCMKCMGQFKPEDVSLEQSGLLEDQHYIVGLPKDHFVNQGENVYAFSLGLAGMQMQQFLSYILYPRKVLYGPKEMDFITGNIDYNFNFKCDEGCEFNSLGGEGDSLTNSLITEHPIAKNNRARILQLHISKKEKFIKSIKRLFSKRISTN